MLYRVLKIDDGNYQPQYKAWWSFGWRGFIEEWNGESYARTTVSFFTEVNAVEYCKNKAKAKTTQSGEVVWCSEESE